MDIMLSWSGQQSKTIAAALYEWLPNVIPGVKLWMSSEDIRKGKRWFEELLKPLGTCRACVICLTPESVQSSWIFFEAGAFATKKDDAQLFTFLIGAHNHHVRDTPLEHYQWTQSDKDDTWRLVRDVNAALGDKGHDESLLRSHFDRNWTKLKRKLDTVLQEQVEEVKLAREAREFAPTPQEVEMLLRLADSPEGVVHRVKSDSSLIYMISGTMLNEKGTPKEKAAWQSAFDRLFRLKLIEDREHNGERFHLSAKGFEAVEQLKAQLASRKGPNFEKVEMLVPELIAEMREDLRASPLVREVIIMPFEGAIYNGGGVFRYDEDKHDDLESKFQILENHGCIFNKTYNSVPRYGLNEDYVEWLLATGTDAPQP